MKITLLSRDKSANYEYGQYRIEHDGKWLEVKIALNDGQVTSFGGSFWPGDLPEIFKTRGPDKGMVTYRSAPMVRKQVLAHLPR